MPTLLKDLNTGVGRIGFELDHTEFAAIGRVTVQWAYLEHGVYAVSLQISAQLQISLPKNATSASFTKRLGTLTQLVRQLTNEGKKKRLERLVSQIANAEQDRHKVTHGLWDYEALAPDKLKASSFRPGFEFEKRYDAVSLHRLADRISEISFCLEYPEGWDAAFIQLLESATNESGLVAFASPSPQISRQVHAERRSQHKRD